MNSENKKLRQLRRTKFKFDFVFDKAAALKIAEQLAAGRSISLPLKRQRTINTSLMIGGACFLNLWDHFMPQIKAVLPEDDDNAEWDAYDHTVAVAIARTAGLLRSIRMGMYDQEYKPTLRFTISNSWNGLEHFATAFHDKQPKATA